MPRQYTPKVESACAHCGAVRLYRPCEIKKFCSHACYAASRKGLYRIPRDIRTCPQCGNSFTIRTTLSMQYCSVACADAAKLQPIAERFWSKVDRSDPSGCWSWKAGIGTDGYGKFWIDGRTVHAHTIAYKLTFGDPPAGSVICHHCDYRPCCRPDHLFPGTNQENMQDMARKGRGASGNRHGSRTQPDRIARGERHGSRTKPGALPRGSQHHRAKLTEEMVRSIRTERLERGTPFRVLSERYGVTATTLCGIMNGHTWKHVT